MGERRSRTLAAALLLTTALAVAPAARAHVGHVISRAERYLKIDATESDTRLVVSLMLGADEGARVLEAADADGDGEVTQDEADDYLAQWAAGLRDELAVTIDGTPVSLQWTDGWLDPLGRVRPVPLTVEMVAHLPLDAREHTVRFEDRMVRRETFDRTDVAFRAHDGAELLACGAGEEPVDCTEPDLAIVRGDALPERYAARLRFEGRAARIGPVPVALGVVLLVALGGAAAMIARRRRR